MAKKKIAEIELIDPMELRSIISYALRIGFAIKVCWPAHIISYQDDNVELRFTDVIDAIWNDGANFSPDSYA